MSTETSRASASLTDAEARALQDTPSRLDRVATWLGWHAPEMAAVATLVVLTAVSWWFAPLAAVVVLLWAGHSVQLRRQRHQRRSRQRAGGRQSRRYGGQESGEQLEGVSA